MLVTHYDMRFLKSTYLHKVWGESFSEHNKVSYQGSFQKLTAIWSHYDFFFNLIFWPNTNRLFLCFYDCLDLFLMKHQSLFAFVLFLFLLLFLFACLFVCLFCLFVFCFVLFLFCLFFFFFVFFFWRLKFLFLLLTLSYKAKIDQKVFCTFIWKHMIQTLVSFKAKVTVHESLSCVTLPGLWQINTWVNCPFWRRRIRTRAVVVHTLRLWSLFVKTYWVCYDWCNFWPSYTWRTTVIFGTLKDDSL